MTLLVGILCNDEIVIATDQQVTLGALGAPTVGQAGTKATIINGQAIYASSGAVGVGQQICAGIAAELGKFGQSTYHASAQLVQKRIRDILVPTFDVANKAAPVIGLQAAQMDALCSSVLAARFQDGVRLIDINVQGGFEALTNESVPFVCHGSGKANADPFLRYLWNVYWKDRPPTFKEAILAAYWTVQAVIDLHTSGVGFGVDAFVLEKNAGKYRARQLERAELQEHDEFIDAAESAMRSVRDRLSKPAADATAVPLPAV